MNESLDYVVAKIEHLQCPVIFCQHCPSVFSVLDWPVDSNGEPNMEPLASVKFCPTCGKEQA